MGSKYNTGLFTVVADDSEKIPLEEFAQANWSMNDVGNNCFNSNQTGQQPMFSPGGCLGKVPKVPGIDRKRDEMLQFVETQQLCAAVEVQKKLEIEQIKTAEEGVRQMQKADIAVLREAKHNKVLFGNNGEVICRVELFGSSKEDKATFRLIGETFVYSCRDVMDEVLQFEVLLSNGSSRTVYLLLSEMSPNRLTRKLNAVGIHFGFKKRVEADFREQFLQTLIETATRRELPLRQGWYQKDGLWDYCYPEEKTWKGVMRYV